jgi:hypothetical protein
LDAASVFAKIQQKEQQQLAKLVHNAGFRSWAELCDCALSPGCDPPWGPLAPEIDTGLIDPTGIDLNLGGVSPDIDRPGGIDPGPINSGGIGPDPVRP